MKNKEYRFSKNTQNIKKVQKYKENGITLIALVITIIVLLILAGATIATLTGENGIIKQAENAKEKTSKAQKEEEKELQKVAENIEGVTQVTDQTPGILEGEGTESNPYKIQSIEDLVVFAYEVTNGRTFLKEDGTKEYVELVQSLDFESEKSYVDPYREDYGEYGYNGKLKEVLQQTGFQPIGDVIHEDRVPQNDFRGVFEGNRYVIRNLKIQQEIDLDSEMYVRIGMFSNNFGVIQNLGIENGKLNSKIGNLKFSNSALLVGVNFGEIKNCYTTGEVICERSKFSCNVGGLVSSNNGKIQECYNKANVTLKVTGLEATSLYETRVGGTAGVNEAEGSIKNSYNTGNVYIESKIGNYVGGLTGLNMGKINTGYNIGIVSTGEEPARRIRIGSAIGTNNLEALNVYYLENTVFSSNEGTVITSIGEQKNSEEMKENSFIELLNSASNENKWKMDNNKNQGYPILSWE